MQTSKTKLISHKTIPRLDYRVGISVGAFIMERFASRFAKKNAIERAK